MVFRKSVCNFSLIHRNFKLITSNFEVFKEIPIKSEPMLSKIDMDKSRRSGYSENDHHKINQLFDSNPCLRALNDIIPASYLLTKSASKKTARMMLVDQNAACDIFKVLHPYFKPYNGHIMEINAGAGVLTEELLRNKIRNLRVYEPETALCNHLLKLINLYGSKARLFKANLLALGSVMKSDIEDNGGRVETLFDGLPSLNWDDDPVVKVIGALPDERFLLHIMFSIVMQNGLCKYGRPEMFFFFSPDEYKKLKADPSERRLYRSNSVIFQVLFDHEELTRVPKTAFIPLLKKTKGKKENNKMKEFCDDLLLVKFTPKKDLLHTFSADLLRPFWFFIKFLMRKKSSFLIGTMEKWVPGSGVRLISKGYTIYTECGTLTPEEYVKIFLEFSSWPEFHSSSFLPSVEEILGKILRFSLAEEALSDDKFSRLFNKEDSVPDEDDSAFDDSTNNEGKDDSIDIKVT